MKFNKNNFQVTILLISAISIIITIFSFITDSQLPYMGNELILSLAAGVAASLLVAYILLILRRINPKQYIYISYANQDKGMVDLISQTLTDQLERLSKYRFEIRTADSIPFGSDIYITMQKYINESDIIIVIVSESYIHSDWCLEEFKSIMDMSKKVIPIIMDSCDVLCRLPVNISNIKALSLCSCESEKNFETQLLRLAKDLIKQRKD